MTFHEFVAINQESTPETSIGHKAMTSFIAATGRHSELPLEDQLRIWIASMIDKGTSPATRKRYVEKLSTAYRSYAPDADHTAGPFAAVRQLRDLDTDNSDLRRQCERLGEIFPIVMQDAKSRPEIALFLYLLLNASADLESALLLRTDQYAPLFPQLDEIIDTDRFHHRRRYVFDLQQSRKRMPQLVRDTLRGITEYLAGRDIRFAGGFSPKTIVALFIARAREAKVPLADIRAAVSVIPPEYPYLQYVSAAATDPDTPIKVKKAVAESFAPTDRRWYAMKLRRGSSCSDMKATVGRELPSALDKVTYFYPERIRPRQVGKKIVKESVPFIPDVVFLKTQQNVIGKIDRVVRYRNIGWMFRLSNTPSSDYSVIDWRAMRAFQRAVGEFTSDMKVELTQEQPAGIGRRVRITGGPFAGYTGKIYDIEDTGDPDTRRIFIRLSEEYGIKVDLQLASYLVDPLP